jgi:hypothetical protein
MDHRNLWWWGIGWPHKSPSAAVLDGFVTYLEELSLSNLGESNRTMDRIRSNRSPTARD